MANEQNPTWAIAGDLFIKAVALAGAVIVYFTHGCQFNNLQTQLGTLDLSVKQAEGKLAVAQADIAKEEAKRVQAETELTALKRKEVSVKLEPRIVVTTQLEQPVIGDSLREVKLTLIIANNGNAGADITGAEVDVFRGAISAAARDVVNRANSLLQIERQMQWRDYSTSESTRQAELKKQWDELHTDPCPHCRLFLINDGAGDFDWKKEVTLKSHVNAHLTPGQSMRAEFVLMSTHFYSHPVWVRMEPYVTVAGERRPFGELLLPIRPTDMDTDSQGWGNTREVAKQVQTSYGPTEQPVSVPILPSTKVEAIRPTTD